MKYPTMEEFCWAWAASGSVAEVAGRLGMTCNAAQCRARRYRRAGVKLKTMRKRIDKRKLNRIGRGRR